ncbi:CRISPR-associated protein [Asticcacaulis biprosthecium C19]|uniref:CRISPR-associated protein n=1 Tax=Asticcacaulis biprosthecium C19 TaxID=715226 RepID=F4QHE7_9CAUL|nr:hypothetical protein [Asticcacaulis biprosthecium]EGF92684.1 CRISPR-associated protein [Asticcacaulis biprosthecium C19]
MLQRTWLATVLGLMIAVPSWAADGPFGIAMGTRLEDLTLSPLEPILGDGPVQTYGVIPPVPNEHFSEYHVELTKKAGVCVITAFGHKQLNDLDGAKVSAIFTMLKTALSGKYGPPTDTLEGLNDSATLTGRDQFAASLRKYQRNLSSGWDSVDPTSRIESIALIAGSSNGRDTYVILNYEMTNFSQCLDEYLPDDRDRGL